MKTNKALELYTTKTHVSCIVTLKLQRLNQTYYLNGSAWFVLLRKLLKWLMEPRFQISLTSVLPTVKYLLYTSLADLYCGLHLHPCFTFLDVSECIIFIANLLKLLMLNTLIFKHDLYFIPYVELVSWLLSFSSWTSNI